MPWTVQSDDHQFTFYIFLLMQISHERHFIEKRTCEIGSFAP